MKMVNLILKITTATLLLGCLRCVHMIRQNEFQMIVYVSVVFNNFAKAIAMLKLQLLRFGIQDSRCNGQIVNQSNLNRNYMYFKRAYFIFMQHVNS